MFSGFTLKAATLITAGTLTLGGTGALAASTPSVQHGLRSIASGWGQQVSERVEWCKSQLNGEHGIGKCVSTFAKTHGKTVKAAAHARNGAREDLREAADKDRGSHRR